MRGKASTQPQNNLEEVGGAGIASWSFKAQRNYIAKHYMKVYTVRKITKQINTNRGQGGSGPMALHDQTGFIASARLLAYTSGRPSGTGLTSG